MQYTIVLTPDDGQVSVSVPALPGVFTWGATEDEALASAREAIELSLEQYVERGKPFPRDREPGISLSSGQFLGTRIVAIEVDPPARRVAS